MATRGGQDAESLRDLGLRLVDNAKAYGRAEIAVLRETGLGYARQAKTGAILIVAALLLALAALPVLVAALGMLLAIWIGAAAGLLLAAMITFAVAGLLAWAAIRSFGRIGSKP